MRAQIGDHDLLTMVRLRSDGRDMRPLARVLGHSAAAASAATAAVRADDLAHCGPVDGQSGQRIRECYW